MILYDFWMTDSSCILVYAAYKPLLEAFEQINKSEWSKTTCTLVYSEIAQPVLIPTPRKLKKRSMILYK